MPQMYLKGGDHLIKLAVEGNSNEVDPSQEIKTVELDAQNGQKILISLSKVIQSEIEEGKWYLLGWNYDIFACREQK